MSQSVTSPHRQWSDLGKGRLVAALMLAACVTWLVCGVGLALLPDPPPHIGVVLASGLVLVQVWFVVPSLACLFTIVRRKGILRRRDCLFLGSLLTCLFPPFVTVAAFVVFYDPSNSTSPWPLVGLTAAFGILLIPFGLVSGWVFWRVGVYPAKAEVTDVALVFD